MWPARCSDGPRADEPVLAEVCTNSIGILFRGSANQFDPKGHSMKKKAPSKKSLTLDHETIRHLVTCELRHVLGGSDPDNPQCTGDICSAQDGACTGIR
jgi:hypothetical protein